MIDKKINKNNYPFPFYNYPYTFVQKMDHYANKIFCNAIWIFGTGIYSKYIHKSSLLVEADLAEKKPNELALLYQNNRRSCAYYGCTFIGTSVLFASTIYIARTRNISKKYTHSILFSTGLIAVNSLFMMLFGIYNSIKVTVQFSKNDHDAQIIRATKAITSELDNLDSTNINNCSNTETLSLINNKLCGKKLLWHITKFDLDNVTCTYAVHNDYYENLLFVFNIESTAESFKDELVKLDIDQVEKLALDPEKSILMQTDFIRNNIYHRLLRQYLGTRF